MANQELQLSKPIDVEKKLTSLASRNQTPFTPDEERIAYINALKNDTNFMPALRAACTSAVVGKSPNWDILYDILNEVYGHRGTGLARFVSEHLREGLGQGEYLITALNALSEKTKYITAVIKTLGPEQFFEAYVNGDLVKMNQEFREALNPTQQNMLDKIVRNPNEGASILHTFDPYVLKDYQAFFFDLHQLARGILVGFAKTRNHEDLKINISAYLEYLLTIISDPETTGLDSRARVGRIAKMLMGPTVREIAINKISAIEDRMLLIENHKTPIRPSTDPILRTLTFSALTHMLKAVGVIFEFEENQAATNSIIEKIFTIQEILEQGQSGLEHDQLYDDPELAHRYYEQNDQEVPNSTIHIGKALHEGDLYSYQEMMKRLQDLFEIADEEFSVSYLASILRNEQALSLLHSGYMTTKSVFIEQQKASNLRTANRDKTLNNVKK